MEIENIEEKYKEVECLVDKKCKVMEIKRKLELELKWFVEMGKITTEMLSDGEYWKMVEDLKKMGEDFKETVPDYTYRDKGRRLEYVVNVLMRTANSQASENPDKFIQLFEKMVMFLNKKKDIEAKLKERDDDEEKGRIIGGSDDTTMDMVDTLPLTSKELVDDALNGKILVDIIESEEELKKYEGSDYLGEIYFDMKFEEILGDKVPEYMEEKRDQQRREKNKNEKEGEGLVDRIL